MLRTVIVDDEAHVRGILRKFLEKFCPQVSIAGEAEGVEEAFMLINRLHPDLVLLDIQMVDGTGFDLLKRFDSPDFKVIFITAHDEYAVQAFKVSAVDFILKPVNPNELAKAVERANQSVQIELRLKLEALAANLNPTGRHDKKLVVKTFEQIYLLEINSITHIESDGCYSLIHTVDQGKIISSRANGEYEEMLAGFGFFRTHRSFLINLSHIRRFEKQEGGYVILTGDHKIPVASRKREVLLNLLDELGE